jgi:CheY-like chemotaxis protein
MSKRVLVVDDDEATRKYLTVLFEQNGYVVSVAENGEDGFKKAKAEKPDLIMLDIMMPKKNGINTLQDIRCEESLRNIPVVILSSVQSFLEQAGNEMSGETLKQMEHLLDNVDSKIEKLFLRFSSYRNMLLHERDLLVGQYKKESAAKPYLSLPDMFIDKPLNPDELIEAVKELLK